jgi:glycosyltransferase involved in cell wall biosynthesis
MDQPIVSIVIPCFRQARFLGAAVESALGQSYPAVEVIVVDDGSDDDTPQVAESFGPRIRHLRRPNGGPAAARNSGIAVASGQYLLFLDADDILHPNAVEWLVQAAAGRDDVLCVCGIRRFERDDDLESGRCFVPTGSNLTLELLENNLNPPLAFLCSRKEINAAGGFDPSPRIDACEDWEMWLRLVFAGATVVSVPRVAAFYRRHPSSHSRNLGRMAGSRAEVLYRTARRLRTRPELARQMGTEPSAVVDRLRRSSAEEHLDAGYYFRQQGRYRQAFTHFYLAVRRGKFCFRALLGAGKACAHFVVRLGRPARA